ncbi:deoxynucleotide monophosphate kinase [Bradyrhizobium neotropicale]|uniref:deoxynucleotide monophosphate kinase family protein n=1 Tax=Bradyrhizobium neotropicale TaxID=1497615 RepID=UPI001AD7D965|nr:deoxynucleotide monophosphate kinase [Bradyrhizobium neotropicale]MBO4228044.1 hypothetical protein [Bradyrhizobium neotropicale]
MDVIGITGKKFHGKDTVARELVLHGYSVVRFADPLKAMLRAFYAAHDLDERETERRIEGDLKEVPCIYLNGKTPRHAMQTLGTEWGRDLIDRDLWTESLKRRAAKHDRVVVPDLRFENELDTLRELSAKVWRVDASDRVRDNAASRHSSETTVAKLSVDVEVPNNGTPFELSCAVKAALGFST